MRRKLFALLVSGMLVLATGGVALADNPHAGGSGHFKGSAQPCGPGSNNPNCPPFGR